MGKNAGGGAMRVNKELFNKIREGRKLSLQQKTCTHDFLPCEKPYINYCMGRYIDGILKYHKCSKCGKEVGA